MSAIVVALLKTAIFNFALSKFEYAHALRLFLDTQEGSGQQNSFAPGEAAETMIATQ
jgi:hypothetical protein